jgi:hypothetical protein
MVAHNGREAWDICIPAGEVQHGGGITECFRVDAKGKIIDTQYHLVSRESAYGLIRGRQLSKKDKTKTPNSKLKRSAIKKSLSSGKTAKLKSSSWYEGAARSINISNKEAARKRRRGD